MNDENEFQKTAKNPRKRKKRVFAGPDEMSIIQHPRRSLELSSLTKELLKLKKNDDFRYSQDELRSLLETKYRQGGVSDETYHYIKEDIHSVGKWEKVR